MPINKGGRGKKAPYETTHIRIPTPIKEEVESLIERWKLDKEMGTNTPINQTMYLDSLKLVNRFIEEIGQTANLHQRNNTNLVKFRKWLESHLDEEC